MQSHRMCLERIPIPRGQDLRQGRLRVPRPMHAGGHAACGTHTTILNSALEAWWDDARALGALTNVTHVCT